MGEYPVAAFGAHRAAPTNFRDKSRIEIDPGRFHYALSAENADWAMHSLLATMRHHHISDEWLCRVLMRRLQANKPVQHTQRHCHSTPTLPHSCHTNPINHSQIRSRRIRIRCLFSVI